MRNIQLASFSLIPASLGVSKDWEVVNELGFFSGYHFSTWCAIFLGSGGGLLVALVGPTTSQMFLCLYPCQCPCPCSPPLRLPSHEHT